MNKMSYEYITGTNLTKGMFGLFQYLNEITNSMFFNMVILTLFMIFLIGYYNVKKDWIGAFAVSGWATVVISLFFRLGGLISIEIFVVIIVVAIACSIPLLTGKDRD